MHEVIADVWNCFCLDKSELQDCKYGSCRKHLNPHRTVLKNLLLVLKAKTNQIK